ncbi:exosortase A [Qipengyuania sp.]|uniref:exosortase A n=1 Tax=Qipengyuania sp. TaxID=2004515 RepID=UPI003AF5CAC7
MPRDLALNSSATAARVHPGLMVLCAGIVLIALTFADWREMAHQWWDIDTYSHILLVPPIIAWLAWLRRDELAKVPLAGWWPGLLWMLFGLATWLAGRNLGINTIAQGGAVLSLQGAVLAILGLRAGLILAFPLAYAFLLVPFGGEFIPPLQMITAEIATALSQLSGIETVADGIHIDTPAGLFIVAEECSGVKFLIAMLALGVLVAHSCFTSWSRRFRFMLACIVVPIVANGIRAWVTIYIAQFVGAEAAGSFDHIVYGWVFFGVVIALVLGVAWRWFEREPEEAGWSADEAGAMPLVRRLEGRSISPALAFGAVLAAALVFAVLARLG